MAEETLVSGVPDVITGRLRPVGVWLALGTASVIAGGLLAAVVAHAPTQKPVWACAYLVLVAGVGQVGLALGRTLLATRVVTARGVAVEFLLFAIANVGVIVGTLLDAVWLVDIGGALLFVALGLMVWGLRAPSGAAPARRSQMTLWLLWTYRLLVGVLVVSIPVGLLLARG